MRALPTRLCEEVVTECLCGKYRLLRGHVLQLHRCPVIYDDSDKERYDFFRFSLVLLLLPLRVLLRVSIAVVLVSPLAFFFFRISSLITLPA